MCCLFLASVPSLYCKRKAIRHKDKNNDNFLAILKGYRRENVQKLVILGYEKFYKPEKTMIRVDYKAICNFQ